MRPTATSPSFPQQRSRPIRPEPARPGRRTDHRDRVQTATRVLLVAFAAFTLLATRQLLVLAGSTDTEFAWTIMAEPSAAFLGASYAAGSVLSVLALTRRRWAEVRIAILTVTVFVLVTLTATLLHAHKLHLWHGTPVARLAAWVWVAVYVVVAVACLVVLVLQGSSAVSRARVVVAPMPRWLCASLAAQGVVLTAAGAVLFASGMFVHDTVAEPARFWLWPLMPLGAQTVGAWLLSFGLAAALVIRQRDLSQLLVPAAAYAAFGAFQLGVVLRYSAQVSTGDPRLWAYVAVLTAIVATGGYGVAAARRSGR